MALPAGIVLTIPGPWKDRSELITSIAGKNMGEAIAAGAILMDIKGKRHVEFDTFDHDDALAKSMQNGSGKVLDAATFAALEKHTFSAALTFAATGQATAERLAFFSGAVRKAGGIAVKVEKSGVAHPWDRWEKLVNENNPYQLYRALMVHVPIDGRITSFGMTQFDLPDASLPDVAASAGKPMEFQNTLAEFNIYRWTEKPTLQSGHTFSLAQDSTRFRMQLVKDTRYPADHHFTNPHGLWELTPVG